MFVLEYKELYIVPEPLRKNRTCQSYRWKQLCISADEKVLQDIVDAQDRPEKYRIVEYPAKLKG